jgi:N-acylneuraminate cytidylyltransferase
MNIAIIPARGGSKRIPRKNIKDFCGKPMIAWSIEAAKLSGLFEHIIVSTDDEDIAAVSKQWGAEVPFLRPADLSDDHTGTTEVVAHAAQWAVDAGFALEAVCCIYATAPFIQASDIIKGWDVIRGSAWNYVFAATEYESPIFRSFQRNKNGGIEMFYPDHMKTRSQDLPIALHDAGQFYWGKTSSWIGMKPDFDENSTVIAIPRWRVQDIDTPQDWLRAEMMQKTMHAMLEYELSANDKGIEKDE